VGYGPGKSWSDVKKMEKDNVGLYNIMLCNRCWYCVSAASSACYSYWVLLFLPFFFPASVSFRAHIKI